VLGKLPESCRVAIYGASDAQQKVIRGLASDNNQGKLEFSETAQMITGKAVEFVPENGRVAAGHDAVYYIAPQGEEILSIKKLFLGYLENTRLAGPAKRVVDAVIRGIGEVTVEKIRIYRGRFIEALISA
jgi:hypothetical protein